ncbi:TRAP transporter substrate-binding protein [Propionivibrio dicarboxylicus]|uniref:Tripartite ATP-independent transporter solute receptor, DctP family n=1 Tax=Propionivibrio dicarboxylicus TaxID=83767 RepID=A0A1G8KFB6_9RHOO|nr:TRAP transporter substrate-binding protein [Propionivibrio dicarboxylicus]SDI41570.1 tripartite ATP-independent transporter solute receptor, DctP family [Propionivibrio dicarboxylicus]
MKTPFKWLAVTVAAGVFAVTSPAIAQTPMKLVLAHAVAPENPRAIAALKFADLVKEKSGGKMTIQVAGASQLGDDLTMLSALRTGTLDMSINSQGPISSVLPELSALGLPYLFSTQAKAWEILDGPIGQELGKKLEPKGLILLAWMDNGIRQITNNKRPVTKPEDLKGIKLRTPPDPSTVDMFQAMGASTQQINFSELYIALQQGVVDGQENPLANIHAGKLHEVQKYISITNHKYESTPFVMSAITWNRLSAEERKIVKDAAQESAVFQRGLMVAADEKLLAEYKKMPSLQISVADQSLFKAATQSVWDNWEKKPFGAFVKTLRAASK